ncbi:MAG: hypothetical protein SVW57_10500 [Thermodesulfobacteriota bacterium]|nr:hypothetical protein [Thermodesulfobacteriota bacterium]
MDYYLAPEKWDRCGYRGIYTEDQVDNLPDDWDASIADCYYLGDYGSYKEAIHKATDNGYGDDLSPADRIGGKKW